MHRPNLSPGPRPMAPLKTRPLIVDCRLRAPAAILYDKSSVQTIRVETPSARYDVIAGSGLIATLAPRIERIAGRLPRRVFVVTSPEIWGLWGKTFAGSFAEAPIALFLPPGEKHKPLARVEKLLRQ